MRRFFLVEIPNSETFFLPEEESKHIIRVLRYVNGDQFLLLNGLGLIVTAEVTDAHPKKCAVKVVSKEQKTRDGSGFHLGIAPTKNLDRMEWMVEKIVEIGATKLTFLNCERSERVQLKLDRLQRVAISAMKQAQHDFLLEIEELQSFSDFVAKNPNGGLAHCMNGSKQSVKELKFPSRILIGPEGDFSEAELELALKHGYEAVHLGESRLRTETAGMVASVLAINS
ncbi:RsmE family RNA methyltransferase [Fluviicola taffensis]|uniref:Ribosomal RNA small subunit methyltransferase E n=1 Tax=Fluviicola taffensis (strain DSM 16823 / NCIMB 13979 / RW262) TaxID=755732 RepID=F2IFS0_FLUTR|nr:RsmE family RNA methyltransferase [Fluviicola taffensis]AEA42528.1 Ribosomal RNA small subunit methyltransferase E [Fluviicola taffensis DSM 16823]